MCFFQKLWNFKVKNVQYSWVKNNKKHKKLRRSIFFVFYCFVTLAGEVKLSITLELNMRFEWDKKHIKEKIPVSLDIPKLENSTIWALSVSGASP